jgi:hypothetical protein
MDDKPSGDELLCERLYNVVGEPDRWVKVELFKPTPIESGWVCRYRVSTEAAQGRKGWALGVDGFGALTFAIGDVRAALRKLPQQLRYIEGDDGHFGIDIPPRLLRIGDESVDSQLQKLFEEQNQKLVDDMARQLGIAE